MFSVVRTISHGVSCECASQTLKPTLAVSRILLEQRHAPSSCRRTAHPSMIEKLNELVPTAHMDKACGWTSHASQEKLKQDLMNGHERAACSVTPENSMLSSPERPQCATENQDSNRGVVDNVVNTLQRVRQASWTQDGPTCRQDCTKHRG